jgi:23S rRNA (cytosine1962-C5)-methyltransferase
MSKAVIVLKKGKEISLIRRHPWVFSGAIKTIEGTIEEGDSVKVVDSQKKFLAAGHWQKGSIAVRILTFDNRSINANFWYEKIKEAAALRRQLRFPSRDNDAYRLIFGEGDQLPGLVIDWYAGNAVIQSHSIGMHINRNDIAEALKKVFKDKLNSIYYKSSDTLPKTLNATNEFLMGDCKSCIVKEYGHQFEIDWITGQKTGFFIDQRENRQLLATYSKGKTVLNTFCYSGGFSVYAMQAGAKQVDSVDASGKAIDLTNRNMALNAPDGYTGTATKEDTFTFLKENGDEYDIIVLDPPAFAKHKDVRHKAVIGYKRLNEMALKKIKPGGLLFTFSCSQVVDRKLFENTIRAAAIEAGREVSVLHYLTQPADHPVNIFHPEGDYLKGLVLKVGK